jgi:hypothetical protein
MRSHKKAQKPFVLFCAFLWLISFSNPAAPQTQVEQIGLRLIAVRTEAEAASLLHQIQSGQSFEAVAKAHSIDPSAKDGGYLGVFRLTDLKADLQGIVSGLKPGHISPATAIGGEFLLLQRLTLDEANWMASYNAGLAAFERARYEEAAQKFFAALPYAERLKLTVGGRTLTRHIKAGSSYQGQNDLRVHFGLEKAVQADRLEILWPSGLVDTIEGIKANQIIAVTEGRGMTRQEPFRRVP